MDEKRLFGERKTMKQLPFLSLALASSLVFSAKPDMPSNLTVNQQRFWNATVNARGFKSIEIVEITPAAIQSQRIAIRINGRSYLFEGATRRREPSVEDGRLVGGY